MTFLSQFNSNLLALSDTPPVQAIIRAVDNDGIDPKSNDTFEVWVNRLTQIFAASARNKDFYQQIRYLDENGQEMVRVDFKNGEVDIVSGTDRLQNKSGSSYFTEVTGLKTGDIFISALNAAIEAARAGEQGRGFAVVADEVRPLAGRVTQATSEIAGLIDGVQKSVEESVGATERGTARVEEGSRLAAEAGSSLTEIQEAVLVITQQVELISSAAEEVTASSEEMVKSIESVSAITEETTAATEEMAASSDEVQQSMTQIQKITEKSGAAIEGSSASTEELSSQVEEVVASSAALGDMGSTLTEAISVFKLDADDVSGTEDPAA